MIELRNAFLMYVKGCLISGVKKTEIESKTEMTAI